MSYKNEFLFSESYLKNIVQKPVTSENLRASLQTIQEWFEYSDKSSLEQWINSYIKPTLDTLGFSYQPTKEYIPNILFLYQDINKYKPISICYVVSPNEDINCTISGKHWAEKIIRNLKKHSFEWGILTDGMNWRIYHTKEPTPYETYLEINLDTIIEKQDYCSFQMFYFFFRPIIFVKNKKGECKFDEFKEESLKATEYIEENLRDAIEKVEDGVLQTLCLGYIDSLKKDTYNKEDRSLIYGGAILYLFRLLFLFYSSARNLLKRETIEIFDNIINDSFRYYNEGGLKNDSFKLWLKLQNIFAEIDLTYNGGLFSPYESTLTRFIEENRVADTFMSKVIFELSYHQKSKGNYVRIEYRDLSVRHLGSLYEGLLEHKLYIAQEDTIVRKSGNKIRYIPQSQAGRIGRSETVIEKGKVYFSEDSRERKLTGSYYTPEDVVEYIVKNTVDTLLNEKKQEFLKGIKPISKEIDSAINESEQKRLTEYIDDKVLKYIEEKILSISVLDPTMGSGHFLVNATNHINNFIVAFLNDFSNYNASINSDPMYWRRKVVENCIYGVDLNPLAVELAKLCLWITATFKDKPLSFLNHHLKQGNALVGLRISDIEDFLKNSKQVYYNLFSQSYLNIIEQVSKGYRQELTKLTEAREDIDVKKEILEYLDKKLSPYKILYDLFTNKQLGKIEDNDFWSIINNWNFSDNYQNNTIIHDNKDYFHWDIEFPDVFNGVDPGFGCVIGNPPYVDTTLTEWNQKYKCNNFKTQNCSNLYAFLTEKGINFLKMNSKFGYIIPMSITCSKRMESLRKLLINNGETYFSNFAERPDKIFRDAEQKVTIVIHSKNTKKTHYTTPYLQWNSDDRKYLFDSIKYTCIEDKYLIMKRIPKIGSDIEKNILEKILLEKNLSEVIINGINQNKVFYRSSGGRYYNVITTFETFSSKENFICIKESISNDLVCSILNSSLFYWYYVVYSNCRDFYKEEIDKFKNNIQDMNQLIKNNLIALNKELMTNLIVNSKEQNIKYSTGSKNLRIFYIRNSKHIIDKIDLELAKHYDFNKEELDFILSFR
jgi:hypothetical protein